MVVEDAVRTLNKEKRKIDRIIDYNIHQEEEILQNIYHEIISDLNRLYTVLIIIDKSIPHGKKEFVLKEIQDIIEDLRSIERLDERFDILKRHISELVADLIVFLNKIRNDDLLSGRDAADDLRNIIYSLMEKIKRDIGIEVEALEKIEKLLTA